MMHNNFFMGVTVKVKLHRSYLRVEAPQKHSLTHKDTGPRDTGTQRRHLHPHISDDSAMGHLPAKPLLQGTTVKRGEDITFVWHDSGVEDYRWKKNGYILVNGGRISIRRDGAYFYLTIRAAKEEDEGEYTLEVSNSKGTVSGSAKVTVLEYDRDWRNAQWGANDLIKQLLANYTLSNPNVTHLRFLLHGRVGVGKSSIINTINCTFQGRVNVKALAAAGSHTSFTKCYETHMIMDKGGAQLPFVFNDIMGLENQERSWALTDDIISALKGHVKEKYKFNPVTPLCEGDCSYNSRPTLDDKVHCLVSVIRADRIGLLDTGDVVLEKMRMVREAASNLDIPQVVFLTFVDECCPVVKKDLKRIYSSKMIKQAMQDCSNKLGVPMNCIYPVKNYSEEIEVNDEVDCLILDALHNAVNFANDFVRDKSNMSS
ncbi:hypothetical protein ACEWY4_017141 [Coilia grayii]|uniref:Ig-like domain-containing protein n=1 Tax=Coilia grayii TaxID=363190 RepID=A0ABD1JG93_9TELE